MAKARVSTQSAPFFGATIIAFVVAAISYAYPLAGHVLIGVTLFYGFVNWWERSKADQDNAHGPAWIVVVGIVGIVASATCGIRTKDSVTESRRRQLQESSEEKRRVVATQKAEDQAARTRRQDREKLVQAALERPLGERAAEADRRIEDADGRVAKAHAICYADFVLDGAEDGPEVEALRRTRERVAKEIKAEYKSDLVARRVLVCRDGASSDCECAGSHRGCCSGHRGVARCEPKPDVEIVCEPREPADVVESHLAAIGRPLPPLLDEPKHKTERSSVSPLRAVR